MIKPSQVNGFAQPVCVVGSIAMFLAGAIPGLSAELRPETITSWVDYIKIVDARNQQHLTPQKKFLLSDDIPEQESRLRAGQVIVIPAGPQAPMKVPSGLIHDWIGSAFLSNATLQSVLALTRDYQQYKDFYHPYVIQSQRLRISASHFGRLPMTTAPLEADQLSCVAYSAQSDWRRDCTLYSEARMRNMTAEKIGRFWCRLMHHSPMWPIHDQYQCRTCLRRFPLRWNGFVVNTR